MLSSQQQPPSAIHRDHRTRQAAAVDFGRLTSRFPTAVVRPRSAPEVGSLQSDAALTVRGSGHGVAGRCLGDGVILDTTLLDQVTVEDAEVVVGAGARWSAVVAVTLAQQLIPPVVPDSLGLSIGGTAIAGGYGESSRRWGRVADNIVAVEAAIGGSTQWLDGDVGIRLLDDLRRGQSRAVITGLRLRLIDAAAKPTITTLSGGLAELVNCVAITEKHVDGAAIECARHRGEWSGQLRLRHGATAELPQHTGTTMVMEWADYLDSAAPVLDGAARRLHPWISFVVAAEHLSTLLEMLGTEEPALLGARGRLTLRPVAADHLGWGVGAVAWLVDVIRVLEHPAAAVVARALAANRAIAATVAMCGGQIYRAATVLDVADS